ncbi:hypothetical protein [Williamsia serinedens]|uniref:hypothetical protein n=1 Tax=Williamsia serinedens TaxID=391736 RepID=UPI002FED78E5
MKDTVKQLWRVRVLSYPTGSHRFIDDEMDLMEPVPGWEPPGWRPEGRYVEMLGTSEFVWPVANNAYGSRSTAKKRADLLTSYGATVVLEKTKPIEWVIA